MIMGAELAADGRHLPSLSVKGLLGIPELTIPELGRVTLLTGKNGAGKSTVLDAVRIYAARGAYSALAGVLRERDEIAGFVDADGDEVLAPNLEALFYGRNPTPESTIAIGPAAGDQDLLITAGPGIWNGGGTDPIAGDSADDDPPALQVSLGGGSARSIPMSTGLNRESTYRRLARRRDADTNALFPCRLLGPGVPSNTDIAQFWDGIALTADETLAVRALNLIYGDLVRGVATVGDPRSRYGRRPIVGLKENRNPVPLRSLGEGAVRMCAITMALANSRGGVLLLDEVENGIHYSVRYHFWKMILQAAYDNDAQVIATTHSKGCVAGFEKAALDLDTTDSRLINLTHRWEKVHATTLAEDEMAIAKRHSMEVR